MSTVHAFGYAIWTWMCAFMLFGIATIPGESEENARRYARFSMFVAIIPAFAVFLLSL